MYCSAAESAALRAGVAPPTFPMGWLVASLVIMVLAGAALLREDWDAAIGELLGSDFAFANDAVADISLLQLATHTSGLPRLPANLAPTDQLDPYKGYDEDALLQGIATARDKQPLGNHYAYSNFGVGLLGYLLGRLGSTASSRNLRRRSPRPGCRAASCFRRMLRRGRS